MTGPLRVDLARLAEEVRAIGVVASSFLAPGGGAQIAQLSRELDSIRNNASTATQRWSTDGTGPVVTVESHGEYQIGRSGHGARVEGHLEFVWEVTKVDDRHLPPRRRRPHFQVTGCASATATIVDIDLQKQVAAWNFDIAVPGGPGCFFHTQIPQNFQSAFPLDVPRWPSLLLTPVDALDFLLGELFQERWRKRANQANDSNLGQWRDRQRARMVAVLNWLAKTAADAGGSVWSHMKHEPPPPDMLIEES